MSEEESSPSIPIMENIFIISLSIIVVLLAVSIINFTNEKDYQKEIIKKEIIILSSKINEFEKIIYPLNQEFDTNKKKEEYINFISKFIINPKIKIEIDDENNLIIKSN